MALEGTIKDFGLPDIFQLIGLQRKTGVLTLRGSDETVTVTFENGMVVNADSSAKRIEARLGNLLVKQGKLTDDMLDDVLRRQKETLQRVGHILISGNFVAPEDLKQALQVQISQTVFRVFRWKVGDYQFEQTEKVQYDREHFEPMSADFILMEGIRMVDEWPMIQRKIPNMDVVFTPLILPSQVDVGGGDELGDVLGGVAAENKISLNPEEYKVFLAVDGETSVQGIIDSTGLGDFEVCKVLFDLLSRDLVAIEQRRGAARAAAQARPAPASRVPGYALAVAAVVVSGVSLSLQGGAPFSVTGLGGLVQRPLRSARTAATRANLERLDHAITAHRLLRGSPPPALEALVEEGLVERRHLVDGWERPIEYAATSSGYVLAAAGADGELLPGGRIERSWPAPSSP